MDRDALLELLKTRRSIRKFKPDPVPKEQVEMILEAARWAPSGDNAQPWRFVVVTDPEKIRRLGQLGGEGSGRRFKAEYVSGHMEKRLSTFKTEETKHRVYKRLVFSGSVTTTNRHGWALSPDGAHRAASRIISICSFGTGSGLNFRILRRVFKSSNNASLSIGHPLFTVLQTRREHFPCWQAL